MPSHAPRSSTSSLTPSLILKATSSTIERPHSLTKVAKPLPAEASSYAKFSSATPLPPPLLPAVASALTLNRREPALGPLGVRRKIPEPISLHNKTFLRPTSAHGANPKPPKPASPPSWSSATQSSATSPSPPHAQ